MSFFPSRFFFNHNISCELPLSTSFAYPGPLCFLLTALSTPSKDSLLFFFLLLFFGGLLTAEAELEHKNKTKRVKGKKKIIIEQDSITERTKTTPKRKKRKNKKSDGKGASKRLKWSLQVPKTFFSSEIKTPALCFFSLMNIPFALPHLESNASKSALFFPPTCLLVCGLVNKVVALRLRSVRLGCHE